MSPSTQPPQSVRLIQSTRLQKSVIIPACTPTTSPNVTTTYQIGSLKSHRGRRNLTTNKRPSVSKNEDANPTKKRKAQERVCPPSVGSPTAQAISKGPSTPMNQARSENLAASKVNDIDLVSQIPARSHGPNSEVLVNLSWQPRPTAILMQAAPAESFRGRQSEPLIIPSPPPTHKLHSVTLVESRDKPTQRWNSVPELALASSDSRRASRMLPRLTGLDPTLLVDFGRQYGAERDNPRTCAHPKHIEAGFNAKPLHPLVPTWSRLLGSASTLEPSKFHSPVKCGFESSLRLAPLLLPEGPYFGQPWFSPEEQRAIRNPQFPNYAVGSMNALSATASTPPNHSPRSPQSSSRTNNTIPECSNGLRTPGSGLVSNLRTVLHSNRPSQRCQVVADTNSSTSYSSSHKSVTH